MRKPSKRIIPIFLLLTAAALVILALRPRPLLVEAGQATAGPLQETVESEGEAREHDRYTVAAPVTGRLLRIGLHDGERVEAGQVVAIMQPAPLGARERDAAGARVGAAKALLLAAEEQVAHDRAELEQLRRELNRTLQMAGQGIATTQTVEQARTSEQRAVNTLAAAEFRARAATAQLHEARAALGAANPDQSGDERVITLRAPLAGPVLRVLEKSERVVAAGTPLLLIGDPRHLEVVVDLLSSDAVKVRPGAEVMLDEWGGARPLRGRVRIVEPYAFTKVSALGIEEQRVNVIVDFIDPPGLLGDGYRIVARIVIWAKGDVLKIPISALFRQGERWCVFVVGQGRGRVRTVEIGHRNRSEAEITKGLTTGEMVVLHPSSRLEDGVRVRVTF